jgi:hypothetical protein
MIFLRNKYQPTPPPISVLYDLRAYALHYKLEAGGVKILTRVERTELFDLLCKAQVNRSGSSLEDIHVRGWVISFREWLSEYFVEFDIGKMTRYFALDEQSIRDHNWNMYTITGITRGVFASLGENEYEEKE